MRKDFSISLKTGQVVDCSFKARLTKWNTIACSHSLEFIPYSFCPLVNLLANQTGFKLSNAIKRWYQKNMTKMEKFRVFEVFEKLVGSSKCYTGSSVFTFQEILFQEVLQLLSVSNTNDPWWISITKYDVAIITIKRHRYHGQLA